MEEFKQLLLKIETSQNLFELPRLISVVLYFAFRFTFDTQTKEKYEQREKKGERKMKTLQHFHCKRIICRIIRTSLGERLKILQMDRIAICSLIHPFPLPSNLDGRKSDEPTFFSGILSFYFC